ncbi:hypothetical protein [Sutterella sp.]|uniref:hypothetical protein n=1 Tax=Sutterella sp. TaxID=1981025 RepID=UPI0026DFDDFC|nr:hypothetical protein [Sutterella sp.]MDO5532959.1 hypothetical protein [Sutterella sp.]
MRKKQTKSEVKEASSEKMPTRMGRPPLYPQGRKVITLSFPVDVAARLKVLGNSLFVKEVVAALPEGDEDREKRPHMVAFRLTDVEFERLEAKGGVEWIKDLLKGASIN